MCGIIGILGQAPVATSMVDALKRLEYRGYDSAGIATLEAGHLTRRRAEGKLRNLEVRLSKEPLSGTIGIGHTRWANGGVYYSGFTTAMPPNQTVSTASRAVGYSNAGQILPMDWDWIDENDGGPTFMSLSASSHHPGWCNALFADGSVHFCKNSINPVVWTALGTIAGGEVISSDQY